MKFNRNKFTIKTFIILMIIIIFFPFIISGIGTLFNKNTNDNQNLNKVNQQIEKQEFKNAKTEEELLAYKLKEQEEKERQEKIKKLQNPEIITKELEKINEWNTFRGTEPYNDVKIHKGFLNSKKLELKLLYEFKIGIDLNSIVVDEFIEDIVVLKIPKDSLQVKSIQLLTEQSYVNGEKSLLAKQYKPEEVKVILDNAQNETVEKINANDEYFVKAEESLRENLEKLVLKLGYKKVIFSVE